MSVSIPEFRVIGQDMHCRPELLRFVRGLGRYVDDIELPRMLHATVLRSLHAHARILGVDTATARKHQDVAAIFTGEELAGSMQPIPVRLNPYNTLDPFLQYPLAHERVRYVGEPVALIVATSRYAAEDALDLIEVDYEPLPAVIDAQSAAMPATLHDGAADNVASRFSDGFGDIDTALAQAHELVTLRFQTGRHTGVPLETRGLVARFDRGQKQLEMWGPAKVPHFNRSVLAPMLGLPEHKIHFIEPDVGGGFGVRGEFYPEDFLVPFASMQLDRPVKWIEDRMEHLIATNHSRQQYYEMTLGLAHDATLLGVDVRLINDMGAYMRTHGVIVPELSAGMFPGPYRWPAYRCQVQCVMTNKTPTGTYRGPGRFECNAARERLLDVAAARLNISAVELRQKNLIAPAAMPYTTGTRALGEEVVYDSGDYPAALTKALEISDFCKRHRTARRNGEDRTGLGIGCFVEKTAKGPFEGARVTIDPGGGVQVFTGASSLGQGIETGLAQIAAEVLHIDPHVITVRHGDTDLIAFGVGSFASRATVMAGNACYEAALAVRERLLELAAQRLDTRSSTLTLTEAGVVTPDGRVLSLEEIAQYSGPRYAAPSLDATHYFHCDRMAYSHGTAIAEVAVDVMTGRITPQRLWIAYDVGTVVNPQIVAGQIEGGAAQAVGGALLEEFAYDSDGQFLTGTFADYLLPSADVMGKVSHYNLACSPSPLNALGLKGVGETGVVGIGAALANAVADALGPTAGVVDRLPMTPQRVWHWIREDTPVTETGQ